jgi:tRNA1(Val) A37 N6-methylase TrmN6
LHITGVEIDPDLADIAKANAARNAHQASFEVVVADVLKRPRTIARQHFHHVMTNPPFHSIERGTRAPKAEKARATSAASRGIVDWLRFARALVRPKGQTHPALARERGRGEARDRSCTHEFKGADAPRAGPCPAQCRRQPDRRCRSCLAARRAAD